MKAHQYGPPEPVFEPRMWDGGSYAPLVAPWLHPHERLLGIVKVELSTLIRRRLPRKVRPGKHATGVLGAMAGAFEAVLSIAEAFEFVDFGITRTIRRVVRGAGLKGGWQSLAGQFAIAVRTGPRTRSSSNYDNKDAIMVFTESRILVMETTFARGPRPSNLPPERQHREAQCLGEILPEQLRSVEVRHTSLSERVDLHFSDGSMAAVDVDKDQVQALEALSQGIAPPPRPDRGR
ncbi:hypothetical protein ACIHAA_01850 [Streptomyces sp. NPDC052040]|uniref:hypothetical protein n=1 Tax=unclassified Streptomyces TaxID=2593676 RepID=UPI0037D6B930